MTITLLTGTLDEATDPRILSLKERAIYERLRPEERRRQYLLGRTLVKRWIRSRVPDSEAEQISLHSKSSKDKPLLYYKDEAMKGVDANLSHKGKWVVMAGGIGCSVGVDIEENSMSPRADKLVTFLCSPSEKDTLLEIRPSSEDRFHERLLTLWTIKEAALKMTGTGLTISPRLINVNFDNQSVALPDRKVLFWRSEADAEKIVSVVTDQGTLFCDDDG